MPIRIIQPASQAYVYPLLIKKLLLTAARSKQEIVYRDRVRLNYSAFNARVEQLAQGLTGLGVQSGTTVAVMDWDSHRYLECFFAIPMMGAVLQTVNVRLPAAQILYTLTHANAEVLLVHQEFLPIVVSLRSQLPAIREIVLIQDSLQESAVPTWISTDYEQLLESAKAGFVFDEFDENAVATTFYTTGTTGDPKGVCFSHRQIVLHTLAVMAAGASPAYGQSFRQGDVYMPMTPMFHVHAWGNPYVATVLGVKQVYPGRYVPDELLALRAREGVTHSHCVPTILQMIIHKAVERRTDLKGWKICIGGASLPKALAQQALALGADVYAGYGMSETGPVLTISHLTAPPNSRPLDLEIAERCSAGFPIPLVELELLDEDGAPVPSDGQSVGEIVVRAPWLTSRYVGNEGASEDLWRAGVLHTQDVGRIDATGCLDITDRIKDVIKTGGEWLSSLQLENLIAMHPDVADVAVISTPDNRWGERPHALVVPRLNCAATLTSEQIQMQVAEAADVGIVPRYAVPTRITFLDSLDRTSVGKTNKRLLRARYP